MQSLPDAMIAVVATVTTIRLLTRQRSDLLTNKRTELLIKTSCNKANETDNNSAQFFGFRFDSRYFQLRRTSFPELSEVSSQQDHLSFTQIREQNHK